MSLTNPQLLNLSFGYLTGKDLQQYCAAQILIKQYEVNPDALQNACELAYSTVIGKLSTRYNIVDELKIAGFTNAEATAVVSAGIFQSVAIDYGGSGYSNTNPPFVTMTGGGGTGATANAVVVNGIITGISIATPGTGYTTAPTVVIANGNQNNRCILLVDIVSILAVRKAIGNIQNISGEMSNNFKWADTSLLEIREGQLNLLLPQANIAKISTAHLVDSNFYTLG